MKTSVCRCGRVLYFGNTACTACGAVVGWCDECRQLSALVESDGALHCANPTCGCAVGRCENAERYSVCNCYFDPRRTSGKLCRSCRLTQLIPDVSLPENVAGWARLELAKRRLLTELDDLSLPFEEAHGAAPPLSFVFAADTAEQKILTGHADGVVTVNLAEADSVQREIARTQFGEPQRTLIGHLRHEVSHYFWLTLVEGVDEKGAAAMFGDPASVPYADALAAYYQQGPPANWQKSFISAYATAHPWEDFAETMAFYFDMRAVLDTTAAQLPQLAPRVRSLADMLVTHGKIGVAVNELNRTMGLTDLLPEVTSPPVVAKLEYVHRLVEKAAKPAAAARKRTPASQRA